MESCRQWSALPEIFLSMIGKRLDTRIDLLRFRAVCTSWRSSNSNPRINPSPIQLPLCSSSLGVLSKLLFLNSRPSTDETSSPTHFTVPQLTIWFIIPSPETNTNPIFGTASSSFTNGFLVKVDEGQELNRVSLLTPLAQKQTFIQQFLTELNLLDFQVTQIAKIYASSEGLFSDVLLGGRPEKLVFLSSTVTVDDFVAIGLFRSRLSFLKSRDMKWTSIAESWSDFQDIITYKGNCYAVTKSAAVVVIDPFLNVSETASPCSDHDDEKRLVESAGELLLVVGRPTYGYDFYSFDDYSIDFETIKEVCFKVYKFVEEEYIWVGIQSLGDEMLFLGSKFSFSVCAGQMSGCKKNCIYYQESDVICLCEFCLDDGSFQVLYSLAAHRTTENESSESSDP